MFRLVARRCSRRRAHSPMTGCSIQYTPPRPNLSRGWATERIVSWADKGEERIVRQSCIVSLAARTGVINTSLIAAVRTTTSAVDRRSGAASVPRDGRRRPPNRRPLIEFRLRFSVGNCAPQSIGGAGDRTEFIPSSVYSRMSSRRVASRRLTRSLTTRSDEVSARARGRTTT